MTSADACRSCAGPLPPRAKFCPSCGQAVGNDVGAFPARRVFGSGPPEAAWILAGVVLVGAVVAVLTGSWPVAVLLLSAALALVVLRLGFSDGEKTGSPRRGRAAFQHARDRARLAAASGRAWATTGRAHAGARWSLRRLGRERREALLALGDAVHRDDDAAREMHLARVRELDETVASVERSRGDAVRRARANVEEERRAAEPTRNFAVEGPPRDRGGP